MDWLIWIGVAVVLLCIPPLAWHFHIIRKYIPFLSRVLQETPLFNIPYGKPQPDAEHVSFPTTENLVLHGCYLKSPKPRRGVILFGLEFGSNRWACVPYCEFLRENGYDIFAFETRGQGESPSHPGYEPMVWLTDHELADYRSAIEYLKKRPDADPRGIGFFGLSKGGSAGLFTACNDPFIRCCVTDGIFATHTTMLPYMRKWIFIYARRPWLVKLLPGWYYRLAARIGRKAVTRERQCSFPYLEKVLARLAPRPLLMIHGGGDTYIKPEMARALFDMAREPKEFWLVEDAKHNQAFHLANEAYKERVLAFFDKHLADPNQAKVDGVESPIQKPHKVDRPLVPAVLA